MAAEIGRTGNTVFVAMRGGVICGSVSVCTRRAFVPGVYGMFWDALGFWGMVRAVCVLGFLSDPAPAPGEAYVEVLAVAPEWQRHGIGRTLMTAAEAHARTLHKRRLTLYVTANNAGAQSLYLAQGLAVTRRTRSIATWLLFRTSGFWRMEKPLI